MADVDRLLVLADVARTINDFRPLEETLDAICDRVAGLAGYRFTALMLPDEDGSSLVIRGSAGMSGQYVRYVNVDQPLRLAPSSGQPLSPTGRAFRAGAPVVIADVEQEPGFEPWREGARQLGYRSLVCIPVIASSRVIGVLDCYGAEPHRHTAEELEFLQLVARLAGVAIETARVAEGQRQATVRLRDLSERLRRRNEELSRLSLAQTRLAEGLAQVDATAVERTARTLAELTEGAVLVSTWEGRVVTYVGPPQGREEMAAAGASGAVRRLLQREPWVPVGGCTCFRVGSAELPLGVLILRPGLDDDVGASALAARHAAAVIAAELQSERADRALETHARPAVLLALIHGICSAPQLREAAGVLGVPGEGPFRVAVLGCGSAEAAHGLSRHRKSLARAGWPVVTATASGPDCVVLLHGAAAETLRRSAALVRARHPEVERVGVSGELSGLAEVEAGLRQARTAAALDAGAIPTLFEDLGFFGALAEGLPPERVRAMVEGVLGRLRAYDRRRGARLLPTLRAYVRYRGRVTEAAAALGVHPNTFHQRLRRAAEVGGLDLRDFHHLAKLVLALDWDRLLPAGET
ncbi:MAG TPA: GAF domain-containing protein [Candidatus Dormibacteraeota bacterium]|nr:GAF domain-containing protein [Candidatus Dormibacteraeota bacterium]